MAATVAEAALDGARPGLAPQAVLAKIVTVPRTTKGRILDAAEALFADHGYYGVSIREITRAAEVELGLIHYHFGRKEELFGAVVARRADEHCAEMLRRLVEVEADTAPAPPSVEAILGAIVGGVLEKRLDRGEGWGNYMRLIAVASDLYETETFLRPFLVPYDTVVARYLDALAKALPSCPPDRLSWAFTFVHSALAHTIRQPGRTLPLRIIPGKSADPAGLRRYLTPFLAAGFYRMVGL